MSVFLSPVGGAGAQFFDNNGNPLTGGKLYTYAAAPYSENSMMIYINGFISNEIHILFLEPL